MNCSNEQKTPNSINYSNTSTKYDLSAAMRLYVVTDRSWLTSPQDFLPQIEETLASGATILQLREKDLSLDAFIEIAVPIKVLCQKYQIPFMINDNYDVFIAVDADGLHVGQGDLMDPRFQDVATLRALIGPNKIIGISTQTVEQSRQAEKDGADYLGVGAVFSTNTKRDAADVSKETLTAICQEVSIPVVAIGGIHLDNMAQLANTGIDGVAVVSAIFANNNKSEATKVLRQAADNYFTKPDGVI